jgi:hypothetical protein
MMSLMVDFCWQVIAEYALQLQEEATVRAAVSSSFVAADLALRLTGRPKPIFGSLDANHSTKASPQPVP